MIVAPVSLLPMIIVPVSILLSGRLIDSLVVYPEHHFLDAVDQSLDGDSLDFALAGWQRTVDLTESFSSI